jgi:hypothetical protein
VLGLFVCSWLAQYRYKFCKMVCACVRVCVRASICSVCLREPASLLACAQATKRPWQCARVSSPRRKLTNWPNYRPLPLDCSTSRVCRPGVCACICVCVFMVLRVTVMLSLVLVSVSFLAVLSPAGMLHPSLTLLLCPFLPSGCQLPVPGLRQANARKVPVPSLAPARVHTAVRRCVCRRSLGVAFIALGCARKRVLCGHNVIGGKNSRVMSCAHGIASLFFARVYCIVRACTNAKTIVKLRALVRVGCALVFTLYDNVYCSRRRCCDDIVPPPLFCSVASKSRI